MPDSLTAMSPTAPGSPSLPVATWTSRRFVTRPAPSTWRPRMTPNTQPAPTDSQELWRWPAQQLAHGIATAQNAARGVVGSCLDRIEALTPRLNALVEVRPDEALQAAAEADRLTASGVELGPLHGVPVAIKVNSDQIGHATTNGVASFKDNVASADSPHVANLRRSGAILLGRSN